MYHQSTCPCCNAIPVLLSAYFSRFVIWRTTGVKPDSNQRTPLGHCEKCDFYFSTNRFEDGELTRLYAGYRDNTYNQMRQECEPDYKEELYSADYVQRRKEFINALINKHTTGITSILDYGGDDGTYIPDVPIQFVYDVSGVEPILGVRKYDLESCDYFDLVMSCQVLEHVSDVDQLISSLKSRTRQYLYIEVPTYHKPPPTEMIIGEHINFFRESSLHALLNKHNIKIIDTVVDYDLRVLAVLGKL
jgi:hypothetical protein